MSCILRVWGQSLDVDALLAGQSLVPDRVWRQGEPRMMRKGEVCPDAGANFVVSEADLDQFDEQVADATRFLKENSASVAGLVGFLGVESAILDFGVELREEIVARFCRLPPEFIGLAAKVGIGVELSYYKCAEEDGDL